MPVQVASFLIPKNYNSWYILEDKYIRGGLRVLADATERGNIHPSCLKEGMFVLTLDDNTLWQLKNDLVTWVDYLGAFKTHYTHKQVDPESTWVVSHYKNCKYFTITVFDENGNSIIPDEIKIQDLDIVNVYFSIPLLGHCTLSFDYNTT